MHSCAILSHSHQQARDKGGQDSQAETRLTLYLEWKRGLSHQQIQTMSVQIMAAEVHKLPDPSSQDKPPDTSKKSSPTKDPDPINDFKEIKVDDTVKFQCNLCQKTFCKAAGAKTHIKTVHIKKDNENLGQKQSQTKKRKSAASFFSEEEENKKARVEKERDNIEGFMKEIDELYNSMGEEEEEEINGDANENQTQNVSFTQISQDLPAEQLTQEVNNLEEARIMIDLLRQEIAVAKSNTSEDKIKIESLEEAIKTKNEVIDLGKATINSLEMDKLKQETCIVRSKDVVTKFKKKIEILENNAKENTSTEQGKKQKKLEDEVKKFKKESNEKD